MNRRPIQGELIMDDIQQLQIQQMQEMHQLQKVMLVKQQEYQAMQKQVNEIMSIANIGTNKLAETILRETRGRVPFRIRESFIIEED